MPALRRSRCYLVARAWLPLCARGPYKAGRPSWSRRRTVHGENRSTSSTAPTSICSARASRRSMATRRSTDVETLCREAAQARTSSRSNSASPTTRASWSTGSTRPAPRRPPASSSTPAAYTHTSIAIRDAIAAVERAGDRGPYQQHLRARELPPPFRTSRRSPRQRSAASASTGYALAIDGLAAMIDARRKG